MLRFNLEDTAMILIDHQVGTMTWASTTPLALLQRNVIILAKFAKGAGMPTVLTSSQETNVNVQGPLMPELQETLPEEFAARIKREGVVNAWDDEEFANACRKTMFSALSYWPAIGQAWKLYTSAGALPPPGCEPPGSPRSST